MSNSKSDNPNNIALRVLFPTLINEAWYPHFDKEQSNIVRRIYEIRDGDRRGREQSEEQYVNGYTSYFTQNKLHSDRTFKNLLRFIYEVAIDYANKQFWDLDKYALELKGFWCNINGKNSYHPDHIHPRSQISGVVYLQCSENSPAIILKDPRAVRLHNVPMVKQNRPENTTYASIVPSVGKLIMFPSWLEHGVPINTEDEDRISMSFNYDLRLKSRGWGKNK